MAGDLGSPSEGRKRMDADGRIRAGAAVERLSGLGRGERARREQRRREVCGAAGTWPTGMWRGKGLGLYRPWAGPAVAAFVG
jgi:hypothetical protein